MQIQVNKVWHPLQRWHKRSRLSRASSARETLFAVKFPSRRRTTSSIVQTVRVFLIFIKDTPGHEGVINAKSNNVLARTEQRRQSGRCLRQAR